MIKLIIGSIIGLFICIYVFQQLDPTIEKVNSENTIQIENNQINVTIEGEILVPGNYKMDIDDTLSDLISKAGGLTENADLSAINLDTTIENREYFYIPKNSTESNVCEITSKIEKVNINTATVEELSKLNYISISLAEKIVNYRNEHGDFTTLEDIMKVSGIGRATYERIRDYITLK